MVNKSEQEISSYLLTQFKITSEDIRFAKNQQWRIMYYVLLLLGAIIFLSRTLYPKLAAQIVLFNASIFLAIIGIYFLMKFEKDLERYRKTSEKISNKFPDDYREIFGEIVPLEEFLKSRKYDFLPIAIPTIVIALFFVNWATGFLNLLFCQ